MDAKEKEALVRKAKNAYQREWYKRNPEKRKEYSDRYWIKKILEDTGEKADE